MIRCTDRSRVVRCLATAKACLLALLLVVSLYSFAAPGTARAEDDFGDRSLPCVIVPPKTKCR